MIIFYKKNTGNIFATIDGRVHDKKQLNCYINDGDNIENIGKFIIGWEETDEMENFIDEIEEMIEVGDGLFKKVKRKEKHQRAKCIEHNMDKFEILQRFENNTPENPFDYKVDISTGNLIKIDKTLK